MADDNRHNSKTHLPKLSEYTKEKNSEIELPSENSRFLPVEKDNQLNEGSAVTDRHQKENPNSNLPFETSQTNGNGESFVYDYGEKENAQNTSNLLPQEIIAMISATEEVDTKTASESEKKQGSCRQCTNYWGIILALISGLIVAVTGVIVKYLKDYHPFTLGAFRFQGSLLPGLVMVLYAYYIQNIPVFEPVWPLTDRQKRKKFFGLILRNVFGTTALLCYFFALQKLNVGDVMAIGSCQPVFVTIAACIFLRESCGIFSMLVAFLTIVGVGVIVRPPILTGNEDFDQDTLIGTGFSIASILSTSMTLVTIRYLKDVHVSLITFVYGIWGAIQCTTCAFVFGVFTLPQSMEHWLLAFTLAGLTLLGKVTMTLSLQSEQAGSIAVVRSSDCLFAFLVQFILLNTIPDWFSLTGASIIVFCVLLTAFRKWITTLPSTNPTRKRFWFVLK